MTLATPDSSVHTPAPARRFRRVSRAMERHPLTVAAALDPSVVRINRASVWERAVVQLLEPTCNAAGTRTLRAFARAILSTCDGTTRTTRGTWARWAQMIGRSTRTVARWIARLRHAGWLRTVAPGRRGEYAPRANGGSNDAPVYALTSPRGWLGERSVTPPHGEPLVTPHASSSTASRSQMEPLRGTEPHQAAQAPHRSTSSSDRHDPIWSGTATTNGLDDMSLAAWELRRRLPILGQMRISAVRHQLVRFFRAGWTVVDIAWAIDHRPDGSPWPHSGAHGVLNPRGWLAHRMRAWRDDRGEPIRSRSQRAAADRSRERAVQEARRQRDFLHQAAVYAERAQRAERSRPTMRELVEAAVHDSRRVRQAH